MIYFLYLILLVFCSLRFHFFSKTKKTETERKWYYLCFVIISLIVGLRYNIGADTLTYSSDYVSFPKLNSSNLFSGISYQPGWILLEATFRTLSSNFIYLQLFVAFFINCIVFGFIWKNTEYSFVALICYFVISFFEFDTEILRESVSVCLGLLMYSQLQQRKTISALLLLILAFSIHISAAVLIVLFILSKIKLSPFSFVIAFLVCIVAVTLFQRVPELSLYLDIIAYRDENKFVTYFENYEVTDWNLMGQLVHYTKFLFIPSIFLFIAFKTNQRKYSLILFGYMLFGVLSHNSNAFLRATNYFAPFYWIVISDAVYGYYNNYRLIKNKIIIILALVFVFSFLYNNRLLYEDLNEPEFNYVYERYFPYKTVLDPDYSYNSHSLY